MHPVKINRREEIDSYLKMNLQESLEDHSFIDLTQLNLFQRIILTTDGTLTEILEAYLLEKLQVIKLDESMVITTQSLLPLELPANQKVISRKILLQGKVSQKNWLYAESLIVPERLEEKFRDGLLQSRTSIGKLWTEHRVETFKEMLALMREPAGEIADHFDMDQQDKLLCRTYRVFSQRRPVMMITEKFPENYFTSRQEISKNMI